MPQLPNIPPRRLVRFYEANGFVLDRTKGSHLIFYDQKTGRRATIPLHVKDLPKGTLLAILRQTGFTKDDLVKWLRK